MYPYIYIHIYIYNHINTTSTSNNTDNTTTITNGNDIDNYSVIINVHNRNNTAPSLTSLKISRAFAIRKSSLFVAYYDYLLLTRRSFVVTTMHIVYLCIDICVILVVV